jgi:hypothetical protein
VNEFSPIYPIFLAALSPDVYSASNRNEYQKQRGKGSGSRAWPVCRAYNLTAISEPIV